MIHSANTETTNILGKPREEAIKPIDPDEVRHININWIDIERYIELINHSIKMTILKNIATVFLSARIDEIIPVDMCDEIAHKYVNAGWNHVYYTFCTLSSSMYTKFLISDTEINIPGIDSYEHVFKSADVKIRSAAIKYRKKGHAAFKYIEAESHSKCIEVFANMGLPANMRDTDNEEQGFMTTNGRFVDRREALDIAKKAGQVDKSRSYYMNLLFSEDIDWTK